MPKDHSKKDCELRSTARKTGEQAGLWIRQTAADLVHRCDFYHINCDYIPLAANVPKGPFYICFRNKEEVAFAVIRYRRDFLLNVLREKFW